MKNISNKVIDRLAAIAFCVSTILLIVLAFTNKSFFSWAFERHQNQISWYIRPLFLLPFCFFSYKRSLSGVCGTIFLLMTSMFWFPKPEAVSEQAIQFLEMEQQWLSGNWNLAKILMTLVIPISLTALGAAFWMRNLWFGLLMVAFMAIAKGIWSVVVTGDAGKSTFGPVVLGVLICAAIYWGYKRLEHKKRNNKVNR